jgi:hypothetical protein
MRPFTKLNHPPFWRDLITIYRVLTAPYLYRGLIA